MRKDLSWRRYDLRKLFMRDIETMKTTFSTKPRLFWA